MTMTIRAAAIAALLGAGLVLSPAAFAQSGDDQPTLEGADAAETQPEGSAEAGADADADADAAPEVLAEYDASTVVARVGEREITLGDLISARQALPAQLQALPPEALFEGLIDQLVNEVLFASAAETAGLDERPDVALRVEATRREILAESYMIDVLEPQLSDEALRARYDEEIARIPAEQEVRARHILVETQEEAAAIREELLAGADFAALAAEKSTGPSGPSGGDLGFFTKDRMVAPFAEAAFALEAGEISEPVQTQFGWHIIKVEERRDVPPPPFDEVADQIRQGMARELAEAEVDKLRETAEITSPEMLPPAAAVMDDALIAPSQ